MQKNFRAFNFRGWGHPRKFFNNENFPIYGIGAGKLYRGDPSVQKVMIIMLEHIHGGSIAGKLYTYFTRLTNY